MRELNRRQENKKEEMRKKREQDEARRRRKEKRAALREQDRLKKLKEQLFKDILVTSSQEEFAPKHRVYDVRDPSASNDGIIIVGGFLGELIVTFTCLTDFILANPQN